jgi:hypothetical protein
MSALLYAAVALLTLAAVRRCTQISIGAAFVLLVIPLAVTGPAMLPGRAFAPIGAAFLAEPLASSPEAAHVAHVANANLSDTFSQFLPWNAALRDALRHHEWPLWNPYELGGDPLAAAAQSSPYHPVTLLAALLPIADGFTFSAAMLFFIAAVGAYLFARALVASEIAALVAAAGWALSTHLTSFTGTAHGNAIAMLPLILLAARRLAHDPSPRTSLHLGALLALLTLCGHPETELHVVTLASLYVAFEFRGRVRPLLAWGLAAGAGALLATAVFILPMLDAIPQTQEYVYRAAAYAGRHVASTPRQLRHFLGLDFLPFLDGTTSVEMPDHAPDLAHGLVSNGYVGTLIFTLALYAAWRSRAREKWFFVGMVIFGWLIGAGMPGLTNALAHLPLFNIAVNSRMVSFAALGLSILAALGIDAWLRERDDRGVAIVLFAVAAALGAATLLAAPSLLTRGLSLSFVRVAATRMFVPLIIAIFALAVRVPRAALIVLLLVLVQRTGDVMPQQPRLDKRAFYPHFAALDRLPHDATPFRIVGHSTTLIPNTAVHYGLEDVRGYQAMTLARLADTYPLWCVVQPVWFNRVDDLTAPFLSLMNVRYAFANAALPVPEGWRVVMRDGGYQLLENLRALPRAFVPSNVHATSEVGQMTHCNDFGRDAWIESVVGDAANGAGRIVTRRRGSRLDLHATMERDGWVVVSEPAWNGWRAYSGGRELTLVLADHAFLAFRLPAGTHDVKLVYRPRAFVVGAWISAVSLIALFAGLLASRLRR